MTFHHLLQLARHYYGPGLWLLLAVLVAEGLNLLLLRRLNRLGLVPRTGPGLLGVLTGPFLHADLRHFAGNFVSLLVLAWLLGWLMPGHFWRVTGIIALGSGLLVWCLARHRNHIGASGLIYGLLGFLVLHGLLAGWTLALVVSVALLLLYSGFLWGMLPTTARTSWESHLFGLGVGLGLAWWHLW